MAGVWYQSFCPEAATLLQSSRLRFRAVAEGIATDDFEVVGVADIDLHAIECFLDDVVSDFVVVGIGGEFLENIEAGRVRCIEDEMDDSASTGDLADKSCFWRAIVYMERALIYLFGGDFYRASD